MVCKAAKGSSQCWTPGLGYPVWGSNPSFLREDPWSYDIPLIFWGSTMAVDPEQIVPPPLLPDCRWFFLYNLHHRRAALLVLRSSLDRVALCVVMVLMCSWMGGSSGSSYLAISIPPQLSLLNVFLIIRENWEEVTFSSLLSVSQILVLVTSRHWFCSICRLLLGWTFSRHITSSKIA